MKFLYFYNFKKYEKNLYRKENKNSKIKKMKMNIYEQ